MTPEPLSKRHTAGWMQFFFIVTPLSPHANRKDTKPDMSTPRQQEDSATLELIRKVQGGDHDAFTSLFIKYEHLISHMCVQYESDAPSKEELFSEAMLAFWNAVRKFDVGQKGVTFGLYARICIRNRLYDCLNQWQKRKPTVSLDEEEIVGIHADEDSDPAHYIVEQEQYLELQKRIERVLSAEEKKVWMLFIAGLTAAQIAEQIGKDRKSVENAIFRARRKLREEISRSDNS